jgi:two-component system, OmpR family, response regulator CpxR
MARAQATILCVDDHWDALIARKLMLEKRGYKVLEATDGSDGLRLLLSHPVDAVILDYQMPGTSGDVVAARMKSFKPQVPIVLLCAFGPLPRNKLKSVDSFLLKSQSPRVLLSALRELLDGWSKPVFHRWLDQWKGRIQGARL